MCWGCGSPAPLPPEERYAGTMLLSIAHVSCLQHIEHTANAPEHPRVAGHVQGQRLGEIPGFDH